LPHISATLKFRHSIYSIFYYHTQCRKRFFPLVIQIIRSIRDSDLDKVKAWLTSDPSSLNKRFTDEGEEYTALSLAAQVDDTKENVEVVKTLLKAGADYKATFDFNSNIPGIVELDFQRNIQKGGWENVIRKTAGRNTLMVKGDAKPSTFSIKQGFRTGRFYFEAKVFNPRGLRLGWCLNGFEKNALGDAKSWAYDCQSGLFFANGREFKGESVQGVQKKKPVHLGDAMEGDGNIVGVMIDLSEQTISFLIRGEEVVAFR
jgi:hypothetical protein